jgi:hypothetical protein
VKTEVARAGICVRNYPVRIIRVKTAGVFIELELQDYIRSYTGDMG